MESNVPAWTIGNVAYYGGEDEGRYVQKPLGGRSPARLAMTHRLHPFALHLLPHRRGIHHRQTIASRPRLALAIYLEPLTILRPSSVDLGHIVDG